MLNNSGNVSKNEKFLIGVLAVVSLTALCFVLIISPGLDKTKGLEQEIEGLKIKIEAAKNVATSISNKEAQLEKLKVEYNEATASMPNTDRMPEALHELDVYATEAGLKAVKVDLTKTEVVKPENKEGNQQQKQEDKNQTSMQGLVNFSINLTTEGTADQVLTFIDKIEKSKRIVIINKVNLDEKQNIISIVYYAAGKKEKEEYDFN